MKRLLTILTLFTISISYINCQNKSSIDSISYSQFEQAFMGRNLSYFNDFFKKWADTSKTIRNQHDDSLKLTLYQIYNLLVQKYNFAENPKNKNFGYVIIPTKINYKVLKNIAIHDTIDWFHEEFETLSDFYPSPKYIKATILYDIDPFKGLMNKLFQTYQHELYDFFNHYVFIAPRVNGYITHPMIRGIWINESYNEAVIDFYWVSTSSRMKLSYDKDEWQIVNIEDRWIE